MPSGDAYEEGFPQETGFGHEEWNFQLEDAFGGYIHGYMYSKPNNLRIGGADREFRIVFYSIHPDTKEQLVAGIYHRAQLISVGDAQSLFDHFERERIFRRRATELCEASSTLLLGVH
jgi:hypothetical protein